MNPTFKIDELLSKDEEHDQVSYWEVRGIKHNAPGKFTLDVELVHMEISDEI